MPEIPPIIVFDKITRRNRVIVDTKTDEDGVRWYMFVDEKTNDVEWRNCYDTEEAE